MTRAEFNANANPMEARITHARNSDVIEMDAQSIGNRAGWKGEGDTYVLVGDELVKCKLIVQCVAVRSAEWPLGRYRITRDVANMLLKANPKIDLTHYEVVDERG